MQQNGCGYDSHARHSIFTDAVEQNMTYITRGNFGNVTVFTAGGNGTQARLIATPNGSAFFGLNGLRQNGWV